MVRKLIALNKIMDLVGMTFYTCPAEAWMQCHIKPIDPQECIGVSDQHRYKTDTYFKPETNLNYTHC